MGHRLISVLHCWAFQIYVTIVYENDLKEPTLLLYCFGVKKDEKDVIWSQSWPEARILDILGTNL